MEYKTLREFEEFYQKESQKAQDQLKEILDKTPVEEYVAVPRNPDINMDLAVAWHILLPTIEGVRRDPLYLNDDPFFFSDRQAAEDFAAALNLGRSQRWNSSP